MKIYWSNNEVAKIELIKNDFVEYWESTIQKVDKKSKKNFDNSKYPIVRIQQYLPHHEKQIINQKRYNLFNNWVDFPRGKTKSWLWHEIPEKDIPTKEDLINREKQISLFNQNVDVLKYQHGISFPGKMYNDQPQITLNKLHHYITHGAFTQKYWDLPNANIGDMVNAKWTHWKNYEYWKYHGDLDFTITTNFKEVNRILFEMNCQIHEYEDTIITPRKEEMLDWGFTQTDGDHIILRYTPAYYYDRMNDVYEIENFHRKYCTYDPEPDIWVPFSVLGKEYLTCWLDIDNPLPFDITNIDQWAHMGFEWQPNSFTVKILGHKYFQEYLKEHHVPVNSFIIGKIPLGYCTNKKDLDLQSIIKSTIINIEY